MLLHDKYPHVQRLEELVPLSLQIVRFKVAGLRRKAYRRGETGQVSVDEIQVPDLSPDPEAFAQRREMADRLSAAVSRLGDRCREIFRLKLQGKTFPEIQAILKAESINTVYTWDSRCRKQLLDLMGGKWESSK
jgi:RNA polymerase sigma-70 factor (ECF subfamily)